MLSDALRDWVAQALLVLGTGIRVTGYPFQYPLPGYPADTRVPGYHSITVLFFHKVRDTLFLSHNLYELRTGVTLDLRVHVAGFARTLCLVTNCTWYISRSSNRCRNIFNYLNQRYETSWVDSQVWLQNEYIIKNKVEFQGL